MLNTIYHCALPPYVEGNIELNQTVAVRVRAAAALSINKVYVRLAPEGEEVMVEACREGQALPQDENQGQLQWWRAELELKVPLVNYRFLLFTSEGAYWLSALGLTRYTPTDYSDFKLISAGGPPEWVYDSIFYQIFPDRFHSGCSEHRVQTAEYKLNGKDVVARQWDEPMQPGCGSREFYGGDIPGIVDKLSYLADLGVNALYLNPIFTAPSNHKYDVADYLNVDVHMGGNESLAKLRQATREHNMRLVLDIVPNHCGIEHGWFKAAQSDASCPEAGFFTFRKHPGEYESWLGVSTLPRLNYASELLRERMYGGQDSAFRFWLREPYAIDGWRLDVANMLGRRGTEQLGHKIGRGIRRAVKGDNDQAWILGEHFFDGTSHLQGDELDATMNYRGFTVPLLQWFCGTDIAHLLKKNWGDGSPLPTEDFVNQLNLFRSGVPDSINLGQLNLLGSHDTPRIMTVAGFNKQRVKAVATFMFAYQGVPCIYYGDEVGMSGGRDPDCRRPMVWDEDGWDHELRNHYQQLCRLRRQSSALRRGGLQVLYGQGDILAFARESNSQRVLVVINRGPVTGTSCPAALDISPLGLPEGTVLKEAFSGREAKVENGQAAIMFNQLGAELWFVL